KTSQWESPLHPDLLDPLGLERGGQPLGPDAHDPDRPDDRRRAFAAREFERYTVAPAASNAARCCSSPCGSSGVPTSTTTAGPFRAGASSAAGSGWAPGPRMTSR